MKSFLIIGLSTFGRHLCRKLNDLGAEVMIADKDANAVDSMMPYAVSARIADCANEEVLRAFGVEEFDACFVCLGRNFSEALEITYTMKELGAKKVISEVNRNIEIKFLLQNGADQVVYPEYDLAQRVAVSESNDSIFDAITLSDGYAVYEIAVPAIWVGRTVKDLNIRQRHNLNIVAVKRDAVFKPVLSPDFTFDANDHLLVMGHISDISKVV